MTKPCPKSPNITAKRNGKVMMVKRAAKTGVGKLSAGPGVSTDTSAHVCVCTCTHTHFLTALRTVRSFNATLS